MRLGTRTDAGEARPSWAFPGLPLVVGPTYLVGLGVSLVEGRFHRVGLGVSLVEGRFHVVSLGVSLVVGPTYLVGLGVSRVEGGFHLVGLDVSLAEGRFLLVGLDVSLAEGRFLLVGLGVSLAEGRFLLVGLGVPLAEGRFLLVGLGVPLVEGRFLLVGLGVSLVEGPFPCATKPVHPDEVHALADEGDAHPDEVARSVRSTRRQVAALAGAGTATAFSIKRSGTCRRSPVPISTTLSKVSERSITTVSILTVRTLSVPSFLRKWTVTGAWANQASSILRHTAGVAVSAGMPMNWSCSSDRSNSRCADPESAPRILSRPLRRVSVNGSHRVRTACIPSATSRAASRAFKLIGGSE